MGVFTLYCVSGYIFNSKKRDNWSYLNLPNLTFWKTLPKWTVVGCIVTYQWIRKQINKHNSNFDDEDDTYDID